MISDEDKERVRQATDMLQLVSETVELRRRGADWWGCCPFHHEKTPSFHVNPSTGLWKCFGCGLGGDVFGYVMHRENLEFADAIRWLADRAGIELSEERGGARGPRRNRLVECLEETQRYYALVLNRGKGAGPAAGRKYLAGRGFGSDVCRRWGLGYAPGHAQLVGHLSSLGYTAREMETADVAVWRQGRLADRFYNRVMFPIRDEQGRAIAFGGRVLDDAKPKYLNTKETPIFHKGKNLFAFDKAKEHIAAAGQALVCEGYTDVMALHEAGIRTAVAALGTSFSLDHVRTLARFAKRIVCLFDGDAAGQRAAERAIQFLDKSEADLRCVVLPHGQDPAEYLAAHSAPELSVLLDDAEPLMDFVLRKRLEGVGPTSPAGVRRALLDDLAGVLAPLKDSVLIDEYSMVVGDWLGVDGAEVRKQVRVKPVRSEDRAAGPAERSSARGVQAQAWGGYDDAGAFVPDDYMPAEAAGGVRERQSAAGYEQEPAMPLTSDERLQLQAEQELLSLMAASCDSFRPQADRIASFAWSNERYEAMAWAMLATPAGTPSAEVVRAAAAVCDEAPRILAPGRVASSSSADDSTKAAFVLDTVDLYSTRRQIRELRARMRSGSEASAEAFVQATELQKRANELAHTVSAGFNRTSRG